MTIGNNKSVTLESDIYATDISLLGQGAKLIVNPSAQNINVHTDLAINSQGDMNDGYGKIQVKGNLNNTVIFHRDISEQTELLVNGRHTDTGRIGEIDIETGKKTEFKGVVSAKKIKVAVNDVVFEEKLDMEQYAADVVVDTGNLEFTGRGKVKFDKDFIGDITTKNANQGEVTFAKTHNIYAVGELNKRIEKLIFTGNHAHNLHNNIYAAEVNFDAGTYNVHANPITIDGNANINGSTFDLRHNLTFTGDVVLSNNITLNAAVGTGLIFQNNAPVAAAATNIIITVNGAHPVDDAAALAIITVNGAPFAPVGHNYDAGTGTLTLPVNA